MMESIFFIVIFLLGLVLPFLLIKMNSKKAKWIPSILLFFGTLAVYLKVLIHPAAEMAVLAEIIYMMILGVATIGSVVGAFIVKYLKDRK